MNRQQRTRLAYLRTSRRRAGRAPINGLALTHRTVLDDSRITCSTVEHGRFARISCSTRQRASLAFVFSAAKKALTSNELWTRRTTNDEHGARNTSVLSISGKQTNHCEPSCSRRKFHQLCSRVPVPSLSSSSSSSLLPKSVRHPARVRRWTSLK
jgi:hypothetical protein